MNTNTITNRKVVTLTIPKGEPRGVHCQKHSSNTIELC